MVVREMNIHLAVPDACFHSPTADQCYDQIKQHLPSKSQYWRLLFGNVFKRLCSPSLDIEHRHDIAALGPLNLFAFTSGEVLHYAFWGVLANAM